MFDTDGNTECDRQSIADVFATFYEQLYRDTAKNSTASTQNQTTTTAETNTINTTTTTTTPETSTNHIKPFTKVELLKALRYLKTGKAAEIS